MKKQNPKKSVRIVMVCCALVVFVCCASEAPEVSSVEQSSQVELKSFFAKLQANDFSVLDELIPATFSLEEAKAKAKEATRSLTKNPPAVDKASIFRGRKYLAEYIEIGADGRFELGGNVDYQKIISDASLTVEERKIEISTLYIIEFTKQAPSGAKAAKIKTNSSGQNSSNPYYDCPDGEDCPCVECMYVLGEICGFSSILSIDGTAGDVLWGMLCIGREVYLETGDEELILTAVIGFIDALPDPYYSLGVLFYDIIYGTYSAEMFHLMDEGLC
ncbi:MAG: hypothetical protein LBB79_06365 [Prevotellaceae bacterium]|jgi:hypothetical protein|nr:hypothetical protein [Prevotellaceae bacterium]